MPDPLSRLIDALDAQRLALLDGLAELSEEELRARPRPGAWSILEIVEHLVAAESVILQGLPPRADLVARPRSLAHRLKFHLVLLILACRVPVKAPSRRMLPTGTTSLAEVRRTWDAHLTWLRAFQEDAGAGSGEKAFFTHPVAGPISLVQALRMDLLHLGTHRRQIARLRRQSTPTGRRP